MRCAQSGASVATIWIKDMELGHHFIQVKYIYHYLSPVFSMA